MKKYLTSILLCIFASLMLAGCTSKISLEEEQMARTTLNNLAQAIMDADQPTIDKLFCPEMKGWLTDFEESDQETRERNKNGFISAEFYPEKSVEGKLIYRKWVSLPSAEGWIEWSVRKEAEEWCVAAELEPLKGSTDEESKRIAEEVARRAEERERAEGN